MKELTITFSGVIKLSTVEKELASSYSPSSKAEKVIFDLTRATWAGYLPSTLVFNWAAVLINKYGRQVEVRTSPYAEMTDQLRGMLLGQGILEQLRNVGVEIPDYPPPIIRRGQPLTCVSTITDLWDTLQQTAQRIISYQKLAAGTDRIIRDAFQTILYELVENAFIHTGGTFPHYGISLARAGTPMKRQSGLMATFESGTDYLEIYVGDLGRGVHSLLEQSMPADYLPPFASDHYFLKFERLLAFALEFSTTSDRKGRLKRLQELLEQPDVDPSQIATGLYCVTELARSLAGQVLIRTSRAILSLKFFPDRYEPEIKGRKELGIDKLAPLPGTHYLVRLPLTITGKAPKVLSTTEHAKARKVLPTRVIDVFATKQSLERFDSVLHDAIESVDDYLIRNRQNAQIVIILAPEFALPSRAEALFIFAIGSMTHGKCLILWANKHAGLTILGNAFTSSRISANAGQATLIGNLSLNKFKGFGHADPRWQPFLDPTVEFDQTLRLNEKTIASLRVAERKALDQKLKSILTKPEVKHSGDSFLLEGQYYTETFYEIDRAWDEPDNIRRFAEWALHKLMPGVDVLIAHAAPIFPMVNMLAELMREYSGVSPVVITHELDESPAKTISQLVSLSGHHAMIITDVICTAERINGFLDLVAGIEIDGILALVDGRGDEPQKPIPWLSPTEGRFLKIDAVLNQRIGIFSDPPKRTRKSTEEEELQDEQVYVIDRNTRAPTLYVRPSKPKVKFESLLRGAARESKSLLNGHVEFRNKHYLYFLNFPKLFEFLQQQIMDWVKHQINFVKQAPRSKQQSWHAYIYHPDESLSWMVESLTELPQKPSIRILTYEHLRAPLPPRHGAPRGNCIIVLPALASGETARLALEYVSRQNPATVLLLAIASRMDAYNLTFYASVRQYRDAILHSACFMEFPVPSFDIGSGFCPQCTELARLIELKERIISYNSDWSTVVDALTRRISASQAVPLGSEIQDDWLVREPSLEDAARAYLRALYESAFVDIDDRRKLNAMLSENVKDIDRFLQIVSAERFNKQFSSDLLDSLLYKAYGAVWDRLLQIILEEHPPFPIGRFIGAIIHLLPHIFVPNAAAIIARYSSSQRDVEEICIGLLQLGIEPSGAGDLVALSRLEPTAATSVLCRQTLDILSATQARDKREFDQSIEATVQLWAQFARSSQFSESIATLAQTPIANYLSWQDIESNVNHISREWKNRIIAIISKIESGPLWPQLKKRCAQIPIALTRLESSIAKLDLLTRAERQPALFSDNRFAAGIQGRAKEAEHSCKEVARELYSFMVNPVMCSAAELGKKLSTKDGSELKVFKHIDQNVPKIFCHSDDLESICGQLIGNWKKHKTAKTQGTSVHFKVYRSNSEVVLEFADNIEGEFDLQSRGGLSFVKECCQAYGGSVKTSVGTDFKSIMVCLRSVDSK